MKYRVILVTALVFLGIIGLGLETPQTSNAASLDDKALERAFSAAAKIARSRPGGKGCESIPYSDLERECTNQARIRAKWCSRPNSPRACGDLKNDFAQADRANNQREMQRILSIANDRHEHAETCLNRAARDTACI